MPALRTDLIYPSAHPGDQANFGCALRGMYAELPPSPMPDQLHALLRQLADIEVCGSELRTPARHDDLVSAAASA